MNDQKPTLSICVPLMATGGERKRNWNVVYNNLMELKERRSDVEVIVAEHGNGASDLPGIVHVPLDRLCKFNRSRARNVAWRTGHGDLFCFLDADCVMSVDQWGRAIDEASHYDCYSPSRRFYTPGPAKTAKRIKDYQWNFFEPLGYPGNKCPQKQTTLFGTISFAKRHFLEAVHGWDESFIGWGSEDSAQTILAEKGGFKIGWGQIKFVHLYHPPSSRRNVPGNYENRSNHYRDKSYQDAIARRERLMIFRRLQKTHESLPGWFDFPDLYDEQVNRVGETAHVVEVGVFAGKSAAYLAHAILTSGKEIRLDLIDSWPGGTPLGKFHTPSVEQCRENLSVFEDLLDMRFVQSDSAKAAERYDDRSLDFVFIDAAHDEQSVGNDIAAWLPKVKAGGVIAGHDYRGNGHPGVRRAVDRMLPDAQKASRSSWKYEIPS